MSWPTADEVIFSLKTFAGAMLALYISYRIGLTRPFWAMTTAYVVAQPWSGAVRSKAVYRLCGTFIGSAFCVYFVPMLSNAPALLTLVMMGWIGMCVYVSVLDRTPRSYFFMLAGYTAAMIAFPSVASPERVFDTALSRVEEISLGIVCATLVHSLVFPRGISSAVLAGLDRAIGDGRRWIQDVLGRASAPERRREQLKLANDITQLRILSTHVPFDTSNIRFTAHSVRAMQDAIAAMTPVIAAVEDRIQALTAFHQVLPPAWQAVLDDIDQWLQSSGQAGTSITSADAIQPATTAADLQASIAALTPELNEDSSWRDAMFASLAVRLHELIDLYSQALSLRRAIATGLSGARQSGGRRHFGSAQTAPEALHRDHGVALLSGLAAAIAVAICCAFWIATGWSNGSTAVLMAAIFSSFFASQDNPVPGIMVFLKYTLLSMPLSALYLLGIMPAVHSFEMVVMTIFPVAFIMGIFIARPAYTLKGMAFFFGFAGTLALHDTQTADLVTFLDTNIAQIVGVAVAALTAALFRTISVQSSARRIQTAGWRELAQVATAQRAPNAYVFNARRLDRVGLLQARLGATPTADTVAADALLDLRIGRDMVDLLTTRDALPHARIVLRGLLAELAKLFRNRARQPGSTIAPAVLERIDATLSAVLATDAQRNTDAAVRAVVALVGLRRALFPEAPDYRRAGPTPIAQEQPA